MLAEFAYDNAEQTAAQQFPIYINYGQEATVPLPQLLITHNFAKGRERLEQAYYAIESVKEHIAIKYNRTAASSRKNHSGRFQQSNVFRPPHFQEGTVIPVFAYLWKKFLRNVSHRTDKEYQI